MDAALPVREQIHPRSAFAGCADRTTKLPVRAFSRYARLDWIPARVGRKIGQGRTPAASEPRGVEQPPTAAKLLGAGLVAAVRLFQPGTAPANPLLVKDVIALYLRHATAEGTHGPAARADREYTFKLFVEACGDLPVSDAKPFHLQDFISDHPEWKSVSSRRKAANSIKAAFNWAARQERILRNPFASVRYAEAERRPEMPDAVFEALCRAASKQFEAVLVFLRLTGLRLTELCQATWGDVDWERSVLIVPRHKSRRYTGKPKEVVLVGEAVGLLRTLATATASVAASAEQPKIVAPAPAPIIFTNSRNKPWTKCSLVQSFNRLKAKHGIQTDAGLHGLRHRLASAMLESGATTKEAAEQLGHSTTAVLERWYYHRSPAFTERMRSALERAVPKK